MIKLAISIFVNIFTVIWATFGWLYFYYETKIQAYSPNPYADVNWQYYLWDKLLVALLFLCAAFPFKKMKAILIITAIFYLFRFLADYFQEIYNPDLMLWLWIADVTAIGITIIWLIVSIFKENENSKWTDDVRIG